MLKIKKTIAYYTTNNDKILSHLGVNFLHSNKSLIRKEKKPELYKR